MSQKKKNLTGSSDKAQGKKTKSSIDLCKVQGNILKGFNKPNVRLVFFRFGSDIDPVIVWLSEMSGRVLNTKQLVHYSKEMHRRRALDPNYASQDVLLHVSLSRSGITRLGLRLPPSKEIYQGLGLDSVILSKKVEEYANALEEKDSDAIRETRSKLSKDPFYAGVIARKGTLDDSGEDDPTHWQEPYKSEDMDALFIVAADQEDDLDQYVAQLISEAAPKGIICVGLEIGKAIFNEQGKQVEHFGFRDGISQPLIVGIDDLAIEKRKNYVDKFYPEDFVLFDLPDDFRWANNGSFLVFRKLEQNVEGFWNFMRESCEEVDMGPEDLAARLMGRWKSGATLMHDDKHDPLDPGSSERNDFQFLKNLSGALKTNDPRGASTPVFSHIRLANPRDAQRLGEGKVELPPEQKLAENNQHRMLRRGIPYGPQWAADAEKNKKHERGLLFACYCRDIHQQFEWVQMNWFKSGGGYMQENDPHARIVNLLQGRGYRKMGIEFWVTLRGGGYFFSPSVYALKHLSKYIYKSKKKARELHQN